MSRPDSSDPDTRTSSTEDFPVSRQLSPSLNVSGRAVARNAASSYVTLLASGLVGFIATPLLLRGLGTRAFGTWSLLLAAAGYLALLELGLGTATITRVGACESDGPDALGRLVSTSFLLFAVVGACALVLTGVLSIALPTLFSIPHSLSRTASVAFVFIGTSQALNSVLSAFSAFLLGTGRMYLVNLSGFVVSALVSLIQAAAALLGASLPDLGLVQVLGGLVTLIVFRRQVQRTFPTVAVKLTKAHRGTARRLLSLGWKNAVSSVAGTVAFGSDLVLIGLLLNPTSAAAYAIALRAFTFLQGLTNGVLGSIGPSQAHQAAHADSAARFDLFCISLSGTLILAIFGGLTLGVYSHQLLHLWLGAFPSQTAAIVVVLCAVLILQSPGASAATMLINSERNAEVMRITVLSATLNVLASVFLTLQVGVIGPALGSLVAVTVFDLAYFPRRVCSLLQQPYSRLATQVLKPLLLPAGLLILVLGLGRLIARSGPLVLVVAGLAGVVYSTAVWFTPAVRDVRRRLQA